MRRALILMLALVSAGPALSTGATVRVIDGDTIALGDTTVRLAGIDAPESGQPCGDGPRDCGAAARKALQDLIAGRPVTCRQAGNAESWGRPVAFCTAGGGDLSEAMIAGGMAVFAAKYAHQWPSEAPRLAAAEARARSAGRGVWGLGTQDPADYRAASARPGGDCPPDLPVKGNVNSRKNTRIYHMPGDDSYAETRISGPGEACFATPAQAEAAGFRRAGR
jgi:endonuclease YncB( thermonuclease family)